MEWMQLLILIHVLSAIIGVGPTFFGHVLVRKNQSVEEYRSSSLLSSKLEYFPKIGGSIAVLSGLILVFVNDYGPFLQLWLLGSLILYIIIQVLVIGFVVPASKNLALWANDPANRNIKEFPEEQKNILSRVNNLYSVASVLGVTLFIFMILKP